MNAVPMLVYVAAGGALGACCRYLAAMWLTSPDSRFPWATLLVNVGGAFLAGFVASCLIQRGLSTSPVQGLIVIGFLGSFTTMSAFSLETLRLFESGQTVSAAINICVTLLACLVAVFAGVSLSRTLA